MDLLTVLLVPLIIFMPSSILRILLGLPFIFFFPGYALVSALFVRPDSPGYSLKLVLSCGMSLVVVILIVMGLHYSPWGFRPEPVILCLAACIWILSAVALLRRRVYLPPLYLIEEFHLNPALWQGSFSNKLLSLVLIVSVLGVMGVAGYLVSLPKVEEKYTEFYLLDYQGSTREYPSEVVLKEDRIISISYSDLRNLSCNSAQVILGIVNQEQEPVSYSVRLEIAGRPVNLNYSGQDVSRLEGIALDPDEKWEGKIGFAPQSIGDNQKVEFLLYKNGDSSPLESLHLWIDVIAEK